MLVCHCNQLSDREIREAIREGADTLEAVAERCGAGACCGGCQPSIERLLRLERRQGQATPAQPAERSAA